MLLPFAAGFLFPVLMQLHWLMQTWDTFFNRNFTDLVINSSMLAVIASLAVVVISLVISFSVRTWPVGINKTLSRLATLGYAIPGAVVAVGILSLLLWTGNLLGDAAAGAVRTMLTASWAALIYAYAVR
jgi:iron(III) transport system permease protein